MASIRKTKKEINELTYHLLSKCYAIRGFESEADSQRFDEIVTKIVYLRNDLIQRANHPENDAESATLKEHFAKVKTDLLELAQSFEELKSDRI